jgi:hypothetical protein
MNICQPSEKKLHFRQSNDLNAISTEWDSLLPEGHALKSRFLRLFQDAGLPDVKFHYLLIFKEKKLAGLAYFQHFHFHAGHYESRALGQGPMAFLSQLLLCQETGILVCGNLFHLGEEGFYFPDAEDRDCLLPIARDLEKKLKPGVFLIKDIQKALSETGLKSSRFRTFEDDQVMQMAVPSDWISFDDYHSSLSKKYRQRANRILQSVSDLKFRILDEAEIIARENELESLYQQVRLRQTLRIGSLNGPYFSGMKKAWGERFQIRAWLNVEGRILAFSSQFLHPGNQREVHYIGFDSAANDKYSLYFNILFDGIKAAIEHKDSILMFGRTGFDAKASAGAIPENNLHYFRVKRGLPSLSFQVLKKALSGKENMDWKNRNPFRKAGRESELQEA